MPDDLRALLEHTARGPCAGGPDPASIPLRARRERRAIGVAAVVVVCAGVVGLTAWLQPPAPSGPVVDAVPSPSPSVTPAAPTEAVTTGATPTAPASSLAEDPALGPALALDALPAMGTEGVVLETTDGVVFVSLDGTTHGHLAGGALDHDGPGDMVPGPVAILPADGGGGARVWVEPATGGTVAGLLPPLGPSHTLAIAPDGQPGDVVLRAGQADAAEAVATFSPMFGWHVSAGHRAVSWHACPEGTNLRDLSGCEAVAYDTDMGGSYDLQAGCWVTDAFADFNLLVLCGPTGQPGWLEQRGSGPEVRRIELPRYADQPDGRGVGTYRNAFLSPAGVVATWSAECEVRIPVRVGEDGVPRALLGDDLASSPSGMVLGVAADGRAVVHLLDEPACGIAGEAGIHLVDPATGTAELVVAGAGVTAAEMWAP